jgi:hypothetical protein
MPKVKAAGFECEYDISEEKNLAMVHCDSQRLGVPYPCILDDAGRIKMEINGSFGKIGLNSRQIPDNDSMCLLSGFEFEVTAKKGIDNIKGLIRNYIDAALNLIGIE